MKKIIHALATKLGPHADDLNVGKAELLVRAGQLGITLDPTFDYPNTFASLRRAQAEPYISAIKTTDPNFSQTIASIVKSQIIGLRSRLVASPLVPSSHSEALDIIWEAHENDAVCALEQAQVLSTVRWFLQAAILSFVLLLAIQAVFAAVLKCIPFLDPLKGQLSTRLVGMGIEATTSLNNFLLSNYISAALIAVLGALFGIYLDLPSEGGAPHWRLVRRYSRFTRCWAGAAAGLLTAALAPVLLGGAVKGEDGGSRVFVAAFVFGFSTELFLKKLQSLAGVEGK